MTSPQTGNTDGPPHESPVQVPAMKWEARQERTANPQPSGEPGEDAFLDDWCYVFESIDDCLVVADAEGRIRRANASARKVFGETLLGMEANALPVRFGFRRGDSAGEASGEAPLNRALNGESVSAEEWLARALPAPGGQGLWLSITARPLVRTDGAIDGAWMLARDINLRKQIKEQMLLRDRALAISAEGFTISDATRPGNPLIYVNEGFERLTGYSREEVLGKNCRFLQGPATNEDARAEIKRAIAEQRDCVVELLNYRKDGTPFWNRLSITPVRNDEGEVCNFIGVQSDITEYITTAEQLQQATDKLQKANTRLIANVNAAAKVQRSLLPPKDVQICGAKFAWRHQPCEGLAGDLLNVFRLDEEHTGFYVLDVSGHGTAAALLAFAVSRMLLPTVSASSLVKRQRRKGAAYEIVKPARVADELNKTFPWDSDAGQFFTIVYAVLNCRTRELRFVSAGHPGFVHVPVTGECRVSTSGDLPIGLQKGRYHEQVIRLNPGDRVYMYSDGVTESATPANDLFGESRLCSALEQCRRLAIESSLADLLKQLEAWRGGAPPRDDISLLACQITK